jgi:hypothetical protein
MKLSWVQKTMALGVIAAWTMAVPVTAEASLVFTAESGSVSLQGLSFPITVNFNSAGSYTDPDLSNPVLLGQFTRSGLPVGLLDATEGFDLTVQQSEPTVGDDVFSSSVHGRILFVGAKVAVSFANTALTLGDVTYQLTDALGNALAANTEYTIPRPGSLSIYAQITDATPASVPEPATILSSLLGLGLLGGRRLARRKSQIAA